MAFMLKILYSNGLFILRVLLDGFQPVASTLNCTQKNSFPLLL